MTPPPDSMVPRRPALGPLEEQVLDALWRRGSEPSMVRDLQAAFPQHAYTTLMTTLDRLYRKGWLTRERSGRAFTYTVRCSRAELAARWASDEIVHLLPAAGSGRPVLSMLVEAVGRHDAALLDELEALVRAERDRQRGGDE